MDKNLLEMFTEEFDKMSSQERKCFAEILKYSQHHDLAGNSNHIWRAFQMLIMATERKK